MHYYKFNIADWGLGTSHLTLEEEAIYFRLINYYYDTEKPIPLETQSVFRKLRLGNKSEIASDILAEFFEKNEKGWVHSRCEKDLKDYRKTAKKNKENGSKGGRPKKNKDLDKTQSVSSGFPDESQKNPNHKPLTNNHKPLTNNNHQSEIDSEFEKIWSMYLRKGNKKTSKARWVKLNQPTKQKIFQHVPIYVSSREKRYLKDFERYISNEVWNDEIIPNNYQQGQNATSPMKNLTDTSWAKHLLLDKQ